MDAKVLDKLRAHAKASGRTLASVLDDAAAEYLERVLVRPVFRRSTERVLDRPIDDGHPPRGHLFDNPAVADPFEHCN